MRNPKYQLKEVLGLALPKYCRGKIVDVGSGHAKYRYLIEPLGELYVTVDNMSSGYQFKTSDISPDVISDVTNMPLGDESFDTVICTEVLEHVEDPFKLFSEIYRVLRPGGYALISSGWATAYHKEPKDYWRFSLDAYNLLCEKSGLSFVESFRKGGLLTMLFYFINRNIELNVGGSKKIKKNWARLSKVIYLFLEKIDKHIKTEDTLGHLIVAKKIR